MQSMVYLKDVVTLSYKQEMCNGCGYVLLSVLARCFDALTERLR